MRRSAATVLTCAAALAAVPSPASAATATQAISELNAQRAANGLPAGITENPTWSNDCALHDRYMAENGGLSTSEDPNNPGYSPGGAFAAQNAVLIDGAGWDSGNPYESAPLHLDQLLAPQLSVTGSADVSGFSCTITLPGWQRPDPPAQTVYTYPGNGATIYRSERAQEQPWTPGDLAGIAQPTVTGTYLIVFVEAPGQPPTDNPASLSDASLTGPSGDVAVRTVDGATPVPSGPDPKLLYRYIAPGGFIIPVTPLAPGAVYHAHVVVSFGGVHTAHDWSFSTVSLDPRSTLTATGQSLRFTSSSPAAAQVTITRANGEHAPSVAISPGHIRRLHLGPGTWQACGRQRVSGSFSGSLHCVTIIVTGIPHLHFGLPHLRGAQVQFPLQFSSVLRGREATLTITPLTLVCTRGTCTTVLGPPRATTIVLRRATLSFPLPPGGRGIRLDLATSAFVLADAPWAAAHTTSRPYTH